MDPRLKAALVHAIDFGDGVAGHKPCPQWLKPDHSQGRYGMGEPMPLSGEHFKLATLSSRDLALVVARCRVPGARY